MVKSITQTFRPKVLIPLIIVVTVIGFTVLYFFVWRTSDNDYQVASNNLAATRTATNTLNTQLATVKYSSDIDDEFITDLEKAALTYRQSLTALSKSTAVTRDARVKSVYDQSKGSLETYINSVGDYVISLSAYRSIIHVCSDLIDKVDSLKTGAAFDTAASGCSDAISTAEKAPDTAFQDQFLEEYLVLSKDLLAAYRQQVNGGAAAANTLNITKQKMSTVTEIELDITAPSPSVSLKNLETVLRGQKSSLLR